MPAPPPGRRPAATRYTSGDEDSGRWESFAPRPGDVVVSSRSKAGTTWVQTAVAMLLHGGPDLPAPIAAWSPWVDWLVEPLDDVRARLDTQPGRRSVKTHTPLDGIPRDPGVTYVVAARHPLDAAVSLYHQGGNIDRARLAALTGEAPGPAPQRPPLRDWLLAWVESDASPRERMDGPNGHLHHALGAWERRDDHDTVLVHYADLIADRRGEVGRLARRLSVPADDALLDAVTVATGFAAMRAQAEVLAPDRLGVLTDRAAFFRRGTSGGAADVLTPDELARWSARTRAALPPDLDAWLHR